MKKRFCYSQPVKHHYKRTVQIDIRIKPYASQLGVQVMGINKSDYIHVGDGYDRRWSMLVIILRCWWPFLTISSLIYQTPKLSPSWCHQHKIGTLSIVAVYVHASLRQSQMFWDLVKFSSENLCQMRFTKRTVFASMFVIYK